MTQNLMGMFDGSGVFQISRVLPADLQRAWSYLVVGEKRGRWLAGGDDITTQGQQVTFVFDHATLAAGAGEPPNKYRQFAGETRFRFDVLELEPPRRLVIQWHESDGSSTRVAMVLTPQEKGTLLTLTHHDLPKAQRSGSASGWHVHLTILEEILGGTPTTVFWPALVEAERLYEAS